MVVIIKDKDLKPENIKKGVTILKVTGTYEGSGGQTINNQNKSVDASTSSQSITADQGYTGLGTVTVYGVDASIDSNITPSNIKSGVSILGVTGSYGGGGSQSAPILDYTWRDGGLVYASLLFPAYTGRWAGSTGLNPGNWNKKFFSTTYKGGEDSKGMEGTQIMNIMTRPLNSQSDTAYGPSLTVPDSVYHNSAWWFITTNSGDVRSFFIVTDKSNASATMTMQSYGGTTISTDGTNWVTSIDVTNKATNIYYTGGGYITYSVNYTAPIGYEGTRTWYVVSIDEMQPEPEMPGFESVTCWECNGTGIHPDTGETCDNCGGSGKVWI